MDLSRTLTELESDDWGPPMYHSHVVTRCHALRRVPLRDLAPEDLRLLTAQGVSLPIIVPLALGVLEADPRVACDFLPGDLLKAIQGVPTSFWERHPPLALRWQAVQAQIRLHQAS